jgi:flagellar assembly protein FliH
MMHSSNTRAYTRFIPSEEIVADSVTQWRFSAVDGSDPLPLPDPVVLPEVAHEEVEVTPVVAEAEHQALLLQAQEDALAQGHAEGAEQGRSEAEREWQQRMDDYVSGEGRNVAQRMHQLVGALDASLGDLQQKMAQELLQLASDIARQVVRQELASNPQALLPVVREALDMLVTEGRPAVVRLNPQDLEVLEEPLREEFGQGKLQWQADASIAGGDCVVESGGTVIDGSIDKRWRRAVAALGLVSAWQESGDGR